VKYAGNWRPTGPEPRTYTLQRWWLNRGLARAAVTVNGSWPDQPAWVHTFDNPTLTAEEVAHGRRAAASKAGPPPLRVVFAGRLNHAKGVEGAVEAVLALRARGASVTLDVVGDGPLRSWVEDRAASEDPGAVRLHGWLARTDLEAVLAGGHVFALPSTAEGFPKVVAEAMAFGCVPVTSGVGGLGQTLAETGGAVVVPDDGSWTDALEELVDDRRREDLARVGLGAVERFTYDAYLDHLRRMALTDWGRRL
jgi:glycosyltransferase involved in cell wall biosynthesis